MDTVTTHVTSSIADELLSRAGYTICEQTSPQGPYRSYTKPYGISRADGGKFGEDYYWELDEALTDALVVLASHLEVEAS